MPEIPLRTECVICKPKAGGRHEEPDGAGGVLASSLTLKATDTGKGVRQQAVISVPALDRLPP